jgi:hypothetical protein
VTPARLDRLVCALLAVGALVAAVLLAASERPERSVPMFVAAAGSSLALVVRDPAIPRSLFAGAISVDTSLTAGGVFDSFNRGDHAGHLVLTALLLLLLAGTIPIADSSRARAAVTVVVIGVALGSVWELLELASDHWLGTDMSLGLADSAGDLVADFAGAVLAALWLTGDAPGRGRRSMSRR